MPAQGTSPKIVQFGAFELDLQRGELRKRGVKIKLQEQPLKVLQLLLDNPGEIISREQLRSHVWPANTFVEFDQSLYSAMARLRDALGDTSESPRFVETVARRGYRFIAPVTVPIASAVSTNGDTPAKSEPGRGGQQLIRLRRLVTSLLAGLVGCTLLLVILLTFDLVGARTWLYNRTHPTAPKIESLAVLPLENFSRDPEQEYFADGMTDELITDLAKIRGLRVISRTSVMQYRGAKKPLREIGKELNVDAVLAGSVQRSGDRVRITAQLIRADSDTHLWAESYDRELRDVLALESEVALAIAKQIQAELTPAEQAHLAASTQVDPEAYRLYLLGLHYWNKGPGEGAITSQKYSEQAIQKDPKFALAYVGLAWGHNLNTEYQLAKEPAQKAMELDDSLGGAHAALAFALFSGDWDWAGAGREFRRALELSPNDSGAVHTYALYLDSLGHNDEAITNMRHALELDPLSPLTNTNLGLLFAYGGQYDQAILQMKTALEIDPNFAYAHQTLGAVYELQGRYQEAATEYQKVGNALGDGFLPLATAHLYASQGRKTEALRLISQVRPTQTDLALGYPYAVASIYARLGDKDQAFAWLDKAYREHSEGLLVLKVDPDLRSLRSDPHYQGLLRRIGLPP